MSSSGDTPYSDLKSLHPDPSQTCEDVKTETSDGETFEVFEVCVKKEETMELDIYDHGNILDISTEVSSIKEENFDTKDNLYCEVCKSFFFNKCEVHGPPLYIADTPVPLGVPDRARQTLPTGLVIQKSSIADAGLGVFNNGETVPVGAHFGPYQGELVDREDAMNSGYSWVIHRNRQCEEYIDATKEAHANWMRYVNCARNAEEKNLVVFQYQGGILYRCCQPIYSGQELLMYYEEENAKELSPAFAYLWNKKSSLNDSEKDSGKEKRKKESITVEMKKEIIQKHEAGMRVAELAKHYNRSTSTICCILKKKEKIKALNTAKGVTKMSKLRTHFIDSVEKRLLVWINEKQVAGDTLTEAMICEKARHIHKDLISWKLGEEHQPVEDFKASRGWFEKFKKRSGIHIIVRHGEAVNSDAREADGFAKEFQRLINRKGYLPQQVFNCDETGLYWKKLPKRTYITADEVKMAGHKPMKDRLTLLFCANASGSLQVKPLLVYHSENPRAFEKHKIQKNQLSVMWRANHKAKVTKTIFVEWVNEVFGPAVKKHLQENNLPLKALLIVDNAPAHPPGLEDDLLEEFNFIKIKYLPPNTTLLIQPMDQQIISTFKKLYTKDLFQRCFDITEATNLTLKEFWKDHFNIVNCLKIIDKAWEGVSKRVLNSSWRKLWPECVLEWDFDDFMQLDEEIIDSIVSIGKNLGLKVTNEDINELIEEHTEELTSAELLALHGEQHKELVEELSSREEEVMQETIPTSEIKDMLRKWEAVTSFIEKNHPDKAASGRAANLFYENAVKHFSDILKKRKKQISIERFFAEHRTSEAKKLKLQQSEVREKTPVNISEIIMDRDFPSKQ